MSPMQGILEVILVIFVLASAPSCVFGTPEYQPGDPNDGFPDCAVDETPRVDTFNQQIKSGLSLPLNLKPMLVSIGWYGAHSLDSLDRPVRLNFKEDNTLVLDSWGYGLPQKLEGSYRIQNGQIFLQFERPIRVGDGLGYIEHARNFVGTLSAEGVLDIHADSPKRLTLMQFTDTLYRCSRGKFE